jgi:membrane-bound serine protease (ClpP class)
MFQRKLIVLVSIVLILLGLVPAIAENIPEEKENANQKTVLVITVDGVINPVASEFIGKSIKRANEMEAEAIIIELDTPGGLDTSMRDIIKAMLASKVPVVVFVSPGGARAASAGAFITIAAHVAAMAPQTNIGAAHPVSVGQKMDKTMADKATNDAAAYIKSLAEKQGRNAKWAEDAVRKSISSTEEEALKENVIDLISANINSLLDDLNGREVEAAGFKRVLDTKDAGVIRDEMGLRHRILDLISNPNIAYMLMLLGFYGLFFELTNPGAIFPGVFGSICLILAFYAFQTLPVNYAGLLLIILGVVLFILETQIASYGVLVIGGIIAMVMGSIMLFETGAPFFKLSLSVIITSVLITALFFTVVLGLILKAHKKRPATGHEGLVGLEGTAKSDINENEGAISLHGEVWSAYSEEPIAKGDKVVVDSVSGLKVKVRKKNQ